MTHQDLLEQLIASQTKGTRLIGKNGMIYRAKWRKEWLQSWGVPRSTANAMCKEADKHRDVADSPELSKVTQTFVHDRAQHKITPYPADPDNRGFKLGTRGKRQHTEVLGFPWYTYFSGYEVAYLSLGQISRKQRNRGILTYKVNLPWFRRSTTLKTDDRTEALLAAIKLLPVLYGAALDDFRRLEAEMRRRIYAPLTMEDKELFAIALDEGD